MAAAAPGDSQVRSGNSRILAHCAGLARVTGEERASARVRLRSALGDELTRRLVGSLADESRDGRSRPLA